MGFWADLFKNKAQLAKEKRNAISGQMRFLGVGLLDGFKRLDREITQKANKECRR